MAENEFIINELLCYLTYYLGCSTRDNLKRVISEFYTADEVIVAKHALWGNLAEDSEIYKVIGKFPMRQKEEKHLNDLFENIIELEKKKLVQEFVARNLARLPR